MKNIEEYGKFLIQMMQKKESDILESFEGLEDAVSYGEGDYKSVFVPGKRKDRVLIVAHVDTVWNDTPRISPVFRNGLIYSEDRGRGCRPIEVNEEEGRLTGGQPYSGGFGIGADDRAGVAMLDLLKDLGHSVLLTNCEELGCLASCYLAANEKMINEINNHQFMLQLDRKGRNDLVFYDVGTEEFKKWMTASLQGFEEKEGSFTDICVLCEKIAGCNISVGYRNEHSHNEILNVRWWLNTYNKVNNLLRQNNIPKFSL
jgi:hypothetical protein